MFFLFPGNPNPPVFNSQVLSKSQTSYTISWQTESNTPVDEYRLLYRKIQVELISDNNYVIDKPFTV